MGPDDEDFDEHEPLPDPTMRAWRHPSELAAVAAMAARPDGPAPRRRLAMGSLALGTALGAVAVLGVLAVTTALDSEPRAARVEFRNPASRAAPSPTILPATTTAPTESAEAPATTAVTTPPTSTEAAPASTAPSTPASPSVLVPIAEELPAAELGVVPAEAIIGVLLDPFDEQPRSTGVVVDGHIATSASAIGGADHVTLAVGGSTYRGTVIGRDPFTDIAVVSPPVGMVLHELPSAVPPALGSAVVLIATDGQAEPIVVVGRVTGHGTTGEAGDGHPLIDLLTTSARLPEPGAGSLLLTPRGALAGMVVDTPGHLAAAVPEATLRQVTRALISSGHPADVWIGVSAVDQQGGARLTAVDRRGPAFAAGLRAGDVVTGMGAAPIDGLAGFIAALRAHVPGEVIEVTVERGDELVELDLTALSPPPRRPAVEERAAQ